MLFEEVVKKRHSVRKFETKEVSEDLITKILELANLSPSAGNLQARSVILVKNKKMKERVAQAAFGQTFVAEAPVVFVICALPEESAAKYSQRGRSLYSIQDATIFASYLQLAATSLGLASCWVGAFDEEKLNKVLELPPRVKPIAIILVGYPAEEPHITDRKGLDALTSF